MDKGTEDANEKENLGLTVPNEYLQNTDTLAMSDVPGPPPVVERCLSPHSKAPSTEHFSSTDDKLAAPDVPCPPPVLEGCPSLHSQKGQNVIVSSSQLFPVMSTSQVPGFSGSSLSITPSRNIVDIGERKMTPPRMMEKRFSIKAMQYYLESCVQASGDEIDLDSYLNIYKEICKLLDNLGSAIGIIGRDIRNKISQMSKHRLGPYGASYRTISRMVKFEKRRKLLQNHKSAEDNGVQTALILHRALYFVAEFLRSLNTSTVDHSIGSIAKETYTRTLAQHHNWSYKQIAHIAFSTLGKKGDFISHFHDGSMTGVQLKQVISNVVNAATLVYTKCQAIYEKHNLITS